MIYQTIYNLIFSLFEGATAVAEAELVCTFLSMCATIFVIVLPFLIVWKVCKLILGR